MRYSHRALAAAAFSVLGLLGSSLGAEGAAAPARPNVVLIVADDLGYGSLGSYGCKDIPTPHIDALARSGVRFTDSYVSCPVCAPTRAGLLTGRYGPRFGFEHNPGPEAGAAEGFGLPLDQPTLAERLKAVGYATGMVGKWHLGYQKQFTPPQRGFDEFYGFLGGAHPYLPGRGAPILRGDRPVEEPPYLTDAFAGEAVAFIERHKSEPFFLYVPFNAVHAPLQDVSKYASRFETINDPRRRTYAAMLSALDDAVGSIVEELRVSGTGKNTLVIFVSDNGGPTRQTTSANTPLRGYKGEVLEGGIRTPCMMSWPGRLPEGRTYSSPIISLDIVPTVLAATGTKPGKTVAGGTTRPGAAADARADGGFDGVNLLPYLTQEGQGEPQRALYWRYGQQWAIRRGEWKLLFLPGEGQMLFDLGHDIGEEHNLLADHPEKARQLRDDWEAWNAGNIPAKWSGGGARPRAGARPRPLPPDRP